jgi:adenylate cyclase
VTDTKLAQRIRRFRHAAYLGAALLTGCVALAHPSHGLVIGIAAFIVAPHVVAALQQRNARFVQEVENVLACALVALLGLPLVPAVAIVTVLLIGTVSQRGFAALLPATITVISGAGIGVLLRDAPPLQGDLATDLLGLAFIVACATPLCALGFEQTMRIHRTRTELHAKTLELERLCARLSRYLAPSVYRRIVEDSSPTARLWRVYLTVCFVDLADFTALTERLAPEEIAMLLNDFLLEVSAAAAAAGGTVDKFLGDGVLVYFGDPASRGPPADARACIDMTRSLPSVLATLHDRWQARGITACPDVRVGVASGFCTVGDFGGPARLDHTVVGKPVNLASRLKDEARLGEVLASESVGVLLGDAIAAAAVARRVSVKGIAMPVDVVGFRYGRNHPLERASADRN